MSQAAARARAALGDPRLRAWDPAGADRLAALLAGPEGGGLAVATRHGGIACFLPSPAGPPRRGLELDRDGALVGALRWDWRPALVAAVVRTAGGDWIEVEPRGAAHPGWGISDRLWRLADGPGGLSRSPLTVFEAVDWASIDRIPPLAEPARLPPGAGTAVLNLLACLAADQGVERLAYRGPYPTEALFAALLESFRFLGDDPDPLRRFLEGGLEWTPAPHERRFPRPDLCLQLRDGVEKVVLRGRAYYRARWQTVTRPAPRRVRDTEEDVRCSLWALGAAIEDHVVLDRAGELLAVTPPALDPRPPASLGAPVAAGLAALLRAQSAPALGPAIAAEMRTLALEWGGVPGDLVEIPGPRARFSWRLADAGAARVRAAREPEERLARALELLAEMAHLLGDAIRERAQSALAACPIEARRAALESRPAGAGAAGAIAGACVALVEQLAGG